MECQASDVLTEEGGVEGGGVGRMANWRAFPPTDVQFSTGLF